MYSDEIGAEVWMYMHLADPWLSPTPACCLAPMTGCEAPPRMYRIGSEP